MSLLDASGHSRRHFIKLFCLFGAVAAGRSAGVLAAAQAQTGNEGGLLRLKLVDFPTLGQDFGSVRVGTSPIRGDQRPAGLFSPIVITRAPGNVFYALDAACTHEGCTVPVFDPGMGLMECPCHGSQYRIDGTVQRGPASFPLRRFPARVHGAETLTVELPDISFALAVVQVQPRPGRLSLEFIAFEDIEYELRFKAAAEAAWSGPVPFALTADGPSNQTFLIGAANFATVFVDANASAGLYAVVMRVKEV